MGVLRRNPVREDFVEVYGRWAKDARPRVGPLRAREGTAQGAVSPRATERVWSGDPPTLMAVRRIRNPIEETFFIRPKKWAKLRDIAVVDMETPAAACRHARGG